MADWTYNIYETPALPYHYIIKTSQEALVLVPDINGGWDDRREYKGHYNLHSVPPKHHQAIVDKLGAGFNIMTAITRPWAV